MVVDIRRCAELLDFPGFQHRNPVCHRHRLNLVVRNIEGCRAELTLPPPDFDAHFGAQLRIQIGNGLIHEEYLRPTHHGSTESDALRLTTAQLTRHPHEEMFNV